MSFVMVARKGVVLRFRSEDYGREMELKCDGFKRFLLVVVYSSGSPRWIEDSEYCTLACLG